MATKKSTAKRTSKSTAKKTSPAKKSASRNKTAGGFTDEERDAMRERAREARANKADPEGALLKKIGEMKGSDKTMAKKVHAIVQKVAPELAPRTWYGMPAYAKDGKVVLFYQGAEKFKARYATLGFSDEANLDKGSMWATSWALKSLTPAGEKKIATLIKQAVR